MCKTNKVEMCTTSVAKSGGEEDFSSSSKGGEFSVFSLHAPSVIANVMIVFIIISLIFIIYKLCCGSKTAKSLRRVSKNAVEMTDRSAFVERA